MEVHRGRRGALGRRGVSGDLLFGEIPRGPEEASGRVIPFGGVKVRHVRAPSLTKGGSLHKEVRPTATARIDSERVAEGGRGLPLARSRGPLRRRGALLPIRRSGSGSERLQSRRERRPRGPCAQWQPEGACASRVGQASDHEGFRRQVPPREGLGLRSRAHVDGRG